MDQNVWQEEQFWTIGVEKSNEMTRWKEREIKDEIQVTNK